MASFLLGLGLATGIAALAVVGNPIPKLLNSNFNPFKRVSTATMLKDLVSGGPDDTDNKNGGTESDAIQQRSRSMTLWLLPWLGAILLVAIVVGVAYYVYRKKKQGGGGGGEASSMSVTASSK